MSYPLSLRSNLRLLPSSFKALIVLIVRKLHTLGKLRELLKELLYDQHRVIVKSEATFWGDNSATSQHVQFLARPAFNNSVTAAFDSTPRDVLERWHAGFWEFNINWRFHIVNWAANQCLNVKGDFVECGVNYGWLSRSMIHYVPFNESGKFFHLIDSWGLSGSHENYQDDIFEHVRASFSDFPCVKLHRGLIPDVFGNPSVSSIAKVAYLSLDLNGGLAEFQALQFFYGKLSPGAVVYIDDYGWGYPFLREKLDEFLADKPEEILEFPCGSALIVKV